MSVEDFEGWRYCTVLLPEEERLVCYFFRNGESQVSCYDENHNVFRLDRDGNVIWQVQRDEQGKLNWEAMDEHARVRGEDGAREPFTKLLVVQPDGTRRRNPKDGSALDVDEWVPGCKVFSDSADGQIYEIDIEAGVARNVTPHRQRRW
ncbi:hypothetical protein GCM10023165_19900 [Variovorax defluvii]|uniref:Uncharacterized protein n=1 Tax=Variovorax defluvii TaxID=913761 RepID=A0ABP8HJ78_9BURK